MGPFDKKRTTDPGSGPGSTSSPSSTGGASSRGKTDATRAPLKAGVQVEQYLIESVLGGGGFSVVYRCFDTKAKESVVLKEYFPNQLARRGVGDRVQPIAEQHDRPFQAGMQQFFSEAYALSQISHPHIIHVNDVFRANNTVYMVSDLQSGQDLRWFIKRIQGELDQKFVEQTMLPVVSGVNALHRDRLLHLDIKPANIFLRTNGGPLLLDFGTAQTMEKDGRFTAFQTLTPGFAPPEQHHHGELAPGSDIYALGATFYACITGRPPPTSLKRQGKDSELDLKGVEKRIRKSSIDAIRWALEVDIDKRPETVVEFADLFLLDTNWSSFAAYEADLLKNAGG